MKKRMKFRRYGLLSLFLVAFVCLTGMGMKATSSHEFCTGCHEMQVYGEEVLHSIHAKDKDGNAIQCGQCHLPPGYGTDYFMVKGYLGLKDLAVHLVGHPEALDREVLGVSAAKMIRDASCLQCHDDLTKNGKGNGPVSTMGALAHDSYYDEAGNAVTTCLECHENIAHTPPQKRKK